MAPVAVASLLGGSLISSPRMCTHFSEGRQCDDDSARQSMPVWRIFSGSACGHSYGEGVATERERELKIKKNALESRQYNPVKERSAVAVGRERETGSLRERHRPSLSSFSSPVCPRSTTPPPYMSHSDTTPPRPPLPPLSPLPRHIAVPVPSPTLLVFLHPHGFGAHMMIPTHIPPMPR
ncbi:MAG: hypothetical protein J3Q66DRAFT_81521 [Benniella sp.]|nr:MAG: hypothetical protein J3Q66DRAFT_81521 [Benniella sp.]